MNILVIGMFYPEGFALHIAETLTAMGHTVRRFEPGFKSGRIGGRLGQQPFFYPYTALMRLIDTMLCPWLPADWARIDLVVCQKQGQAELHTRATRATNEK